MSERPAIQGSIRPRDATAWIKAVRKAGETGPIRVEIESDGKRVIITSRKAESAAEAKIDLAGEIRGWQP